MNRRNFLRSIGAATVAVAAVPITALLAKREPLLNGQLGTYEGFKFYEGVKATWRGPRANLHNLPRYGGALREHTVQSQSRDIYAAPAFTFVNCPHTSFACECYRNSSKELRFKA